VAEDNLFSYFHYCIPKWSETGLLRESNNYAQAHYSMSSKSISHRVKPEYYNPRNAVVLSQGEPTAPHCLRAGIFLQVTTPSFEIPDTVYQISYKGAS